MGWCSFNLQEPVKDWFTRLWESNEEYKVLDCALVKRMTLYAAIQVNETGQVLCAVYLVRWSKDYYNFSYKDLTEFSGPCAYDCPQRIINMLSPLDDTNDPNGYAREWRLKVEAYHDQRNKLKAESVVMVSEPIEFSNGAAYQYFRKKAKKVWAGVLDKGCFIPVIPVRLNLLNYNFEVI